VRILFAGTPDVVIPSLNWIVSSEHELLGILTRPASAQGRSSALIDSPAAEFAKNNSINLYTSIDEITSEDLLSSVDLVIVIAYGKIIPNDLLGIPKHGWINVHFSLLPKYRGAAPVQRAIWNGEKISGISIFQLDAGMDTGPLYLQKTVSIDQVQTSGDCLEMMSHLVPEMLGETLNKIQNLEPPTPQDNSVSTLAPKIAKSESRINWSDSASSIRNMVRALNPAPRAKSTFRDNEVFFYEVNVSDMRSEKASGTISFENQRLFAATNDFDIEIVKVQSSGKNVMSGADWYRGIQAKDDPLEIKYV
jgi:methionyl-tRNA formyltransferase